MKKRLHILNEVNLGFKNEAFEWSYRDHYFESNYTSSRIALILGTLLYAGFIFIDQVIHPSMIQWATNIRLFIISPFLSVCVALIHLRAFRNPKALHQLTILVVIFAQCGHFALAFHPEVHPSYLLVLTFILILFSCTLARIRLKYCVLICLSISCVFVWQTSEILQLEFDDWLLQVTAILSVSIVGMLTSHLIEKANRQEFQQLHVIEKQKQEISAQNEELIKHTQTQHQLIEHLHSKNQDLSHFAHLASHDLKTPVRGISSLLSFLQEEVQKLNVSTLDSYVHLIHERAEKLNVLIDGIRKYIEAGKSHKASDLLILEEILQFNNELEIHIPFNLEIRGIFPELRISENDFKLIYIESIRNAIKHHKGTQGIIHIEGKILHKDFCLSISDDGPGISPLYYERAFKMFETLDAEKKRHFAGIGLSLVQKSIQKYGGKASIGTNTYGGTTVELLFPGPIIKNSFPKEDFFASYTLSPMQAVNPTK